MSEGPVVPGYSELRPIGRGGFSTVFRATQDGMGRDVAVKVLNAGFEDDRQRRVFERECQLMGQVSRHPNIVTVFHSTFSTDGRPCIVMELYNGTYRERVGTNGPMSISDALDVGVKISGALQTVHDAGILHRDIKPHNVFVSGYGEPALADFGISSISNERSITGGGGFSLDYSAPEILDEGEAGAAADIYALGASLYHMISGEAPFAHHGPAGERLRSTIRRIVTEPPPSLTRADADPALDRLLQKTMAKQASDRPSSALEFGRALQEIQHSLGAPVTQLTSSRPDTSAAFDPAEPTLPPPGAVSNPTKTEPPNHTVTIVRPAVGDQPTGPKSDPELDPEIAADRRKKVLMTALAFGVVSIAAITVLALGIGSGNPNTVVVPTTTTPIDESFYASVDPPTDLTVTRTDPDGVVISWSSTETDAQFEISRVGGGADESITTATSPYAWAGIPAQDTACFQIRTVTATRVSIGAAGPICG